MAMNLTKINILIFYLNIVLLYISFHEGVSCFGSFYKKFPEYQSQLLKSDKAMSSNGNTQFVIYCNAESPKCYKHIFKTAHLVFLKPPQMYEIYEGESIKIVNERKNKRITFNSRTIFSNDLVTFPSFSPYCVGVAAKGPYVIKLKINEANRWKALQMTMGILLFIKSTKIRQSSILHYIFGAIFGVVTLVFAFIHNISKRIKNKVTRIATVFMGLSIVLCMLGMVYYIIPYFISNYGPYVLGYAILILYFNVSYFHKYRSYIYNYTIKVTEILLWLFAAYVIYHSSEYKESLLLLSSVLLLWKNIPKYCILKLQCLWYHYFPAKYLTEEEFLSVGLSEAHNALEKLRDYLNTPECPHLTGLKDPDKLSAFMKGSSHLTQEEIDLYKSM